MSLAETCYAEEEYKEALACYEAALKLDRSLAEAYLGSADIYIAESEYQDAADILKKGLERVRGKKKEELREKLEDIYNRWVTALISMQDYDVPGLFWMKGSSFWMPMYWPRKDNG